MGAPFRSAEDRVSEDDFEAVLAVLAGPSPWQQYITPNLKAARANIPGHPFQIVNSGRFTQVMADLGETGDVRNTPGVTDKKRGQITMQDEFGQNSHAARFGHALHETVHLVSHPAGKSPQGRSTVRGMLADGPFEGLVEAVTEDILQEQKIALAQGDQRGHPKRVPVVRQLFQTLAQHRIAPVPFFASALFVGDMTVNQFLMQMHWTFSAGGWAQIQALTTNDQRDVAIRKIEELAVAQDRQHAMEDEVIRRHFRQLGARWAQASPPSPGFIFKRGVSPPPPVRD
jgi:hypothetical protein